MASHCDACEPVAACRPARDMVMLGAILVSITYYVRFVKGGFFQLTEIKYQISETGVWTGVASASAGKPPRPCGGTPPKRGIGAHTWGAGCVPHTRAVRGGLRLSNPSLRA
jgi:hypothetical protein